jgi:V/A-type H+-transporting ATPase subunit E
MAGSIETFVQRLQEEGVNAGRTEAGKIVDEAKAQADKIVADAQAEADRIREDAREKGEQTLQQGRNELQLASRDVLLRLRETIVVVLESVLRQAAEQTLNDDDFLRVLLHDICVQYAQSDAAGDQPVEIRLSDEKLKAATEWAISEMKQRGHEDWQSRIDLKGKLTSAGFEYNATGGMVEVTPESVASVLGEMLSARIREMIDQVIADKGQ